MNRGGKPFWGIALVVLGVLMILNQLNLFRFSWIWGFSAPVILFVIAFFSVAGFVSKGPPAAGLLVPAGILAGVGLTLLLGSTFGLMRFVWPGFILAPAIGLLLLYLFSREHSPGLLVPVGILVTIAGTCFLSSLLGIWHILWPGFVLSPAVGLLLLYWFGERHNRGLLVPIGILGGISFFSFFGTFMMGSYGYGKFGLAGVLILIGLLTLLKKPGESARAGKWQAPRQDAGAPGADNTQQSWDESRSRQEWREYGQKAYQEYDARFNNPDWARTDGTGSNPGNGVNPGHGGTAGNGMNTGNGMNPENMDNPYVNSDFSRNAPKR